jgi:hypothetical protein
MFRSALFVIPFLLIGCAASPARSVIVSDAASISGMAALPLEVPTPNRASNDAAADAATELFARVTPQSQQPPMALPPQAPPPRPRERLSVKGGYYGSSEDGIDDGYIINLSWMRPTSDLFSSEVEVGYLDVSGTDKGVDRDVWGIPFMANGRLNIPVGQKIELYGGLGLGTIYYEAEAKTAGVRVSGDGFLFAGDAYFGGDIQLGKQLYLGLEGKYYVTDNNSDIGGGLDAYVVLLTLGFSR